MIQVLASHFEFILLILTRRKCDLRKVEKATIQLLAFHFEINWPVQNAT